MERTLILGAGGHAQVIADILLQVSDAGKQFVPIGYLDDNPDLTGQHFLGLPVLGLLNDLPHVEHERVIIGIGDNAIRSRIYDTLVRRQERFVTACHPKAIIASNIEIGAGAVICAGVVVNPASRIGANVILNTGCTVDHHNLICDHVHIGPGSHLGGDVKVATGTLVGIGSTILPQRTLGEWSIVAAGSVVSRNLPDRVVAAGNPARTNPSDIG